MRLYLVQHAEAKSEEEAPSKPLSDKGWEDIRRMAGYAERTLHLHVAQIFHSGTLRAKQTAEVLAEHLNPAKGVAATDSLEPLADPKTWTSCVTEATTDVLLVGHLPHLAKLAGYLLTGDESREVVKFRNGGIVCLERDENGDWSLEWIVTPEILP